MVTRRFRALKPEIRVLGVDDGVFKPRTRGSVPVVGIVFRGGYWLDGVMHTRIKIDGLDATDRIASMINRSPHRRQLGVTVLDGVTFAGFNVVNINELGDSTGIPVIAVTREKPDFGRIHAALRNLSDSEARWAALTSGGPVYYSSVRGRGVFMQLSGVSEEDAGRILKLVSTRSVIPEALRVAHLVASGISKS